MSRGLALLVLAIGAIGLPACAGQGSAKPRTYHFSDCQAGAMPDCVAGSNLNAGTEASPKRDLSGVSVNDLAGGSSLLLKRGGAWNVIGLLLENSYVTPAAPLTIEAYGSGPKPLLRVPTGNGIHLGGNWNNQSNDGGYTLRDLRLDGLGTAQWGLWLVQNVRAITIENVEITGFAIGIHASGGSPHGVSAVTLRNSSISRNRSMGFLGTVSDSRFEGNLFESNNFGGSNREHAIYLSRGNRNTIRDNRFVRNSAVNGRCTGGNVTVHGVVDGLSIENNTIEQDASLPGCYGFAITAGYASQESFRNVTVRGNTVINIGMCAVCVNSAPGIVVENNRSIMLTTAALHYAVWEPANAQQDIPSVGAIVKDNVLCLRGAAKGDSRATQLSASVVSTNNSVRTGTEAAAGPCSLAPRN